ncbi:hypothetical protein CU097_013737 [Rhizopus azygosporus]|uniref:Nascent polypeptide-associated complex subunit alpha-like UBA domain-containing protein n=3 Tax=Rhizopus TaxID=4842 RepID=A0A2G4SZ64_RHIZD|nr:uncharacterized protein RHIMIDRAFT_236050 [Rhizopus microsporus ATCC 52813]ORE11809.1 hypothetical protein BCV72DRAFT_246803 [Rhizopus microsporus var. microsporus]PHZ14059.1 hypothetical protein RHIMIDRAFT_236050 [Rhizopus microsporus ATCC 52813]RCH97310.1 hypothetical protein CU097_013737 [Rhizopus azygosporus]CEG67386.1 hypothetical protein RMATCC62417_03823 [Rhizopus microsporus]
MTDHHHHDHSNCNHDHDNTKKVTDAVNDELALRQKTAEKLTKALVEMQELANEHKKTLPKPLTGAVNKADVELLVKEMQLTKAEAEAALRANGGDAVAAIKKWIEC